MKRETFSNMIAQNIDNEKSNPTQAYQEAIEALELDQKEAIVFMDIDKLELFQNKLAKRLKKTKSWNYAPEKREAVIKARRYLQEMLGVEISYR